MSTARAAALRLLAVHARSRAELGERLALKGFDASTVATVLDDLTGIRLLDDESFARDWVQVRSEVRGSAPAVLRRELLAKGVDAGLIEEAIAGTFPGDAVAGRAWEVGRMRLQRLQGLTPEVQARRLAGYLMRRGYPEGLAKRVAVELTGVFEVH